MTPKHRVARSSSIAGLATTVFVVFLTLRLTDQIDWAWYWVAAPLFAVPAAIIAFLVVSLAIIAVAAVLTQLFESTGPRQRDE